MLLSRQRLPSPAARRVRPRLEELEDRRVLSITYHGGPLLAHVAVAPVYLGQDWTSPTYAAQAGKLTAYLGFLVQSSYMDMLGEYSVGRGSIDGAGYVDPGLASGQKVDDSTIQTDLLNDINQGLLPAPSANQLYVVFTAPNVVVTSDGQNSQQDFFGYHNVFKDTAGQLYHYAVVVHPVGNGDFYNLSDFQTMTQVASHEIAESATDPAALTNLETGGWFGPMTGFDGDQEIADVADGQYDIGTLGGYTVQAVWSNKFQADIVPWNAQKASAVKPTDQPLQVPDNLAVVAAALTHSDEYFSALITQDYRKYLNRLPAPAELQAWLAAVDGGTTDEQLLAAFIGSDEFYQHAGGTNKTWVNALYHNLLNRAPDAAGQAAWVNALAGGVARSQVAVGFATSPEAEGLVVKSDYQRFLGRSPTQAEISSWVGAFESGTTNEQVVAGFLASLEYYLNSKKGKGTPADWVSSAYADLFQRRPSAAESAAWFQVFN